jgi:hypothetical protein
MKRTHGYRLLTGVMAFALLSTTSCGGSGGDGKGGTELVRVLISAMDGTEPRLIDNVNFPELFVLDPRIEYVELGFLSDPEVKNFLGPATYMPSMTPNDAEPNRAGYIALSINPFAGQAIAPSRVAFRTRAEFPGNPSSFRLRSSVDGYVGTLRTINTSSPQSLSVSFVAPASDQFFQLRWQAHNDFGDNGGGSAGFSRDDVVVSE